MSTSRSWSAPRGSWPGVIADAVYAQPGERAGLEALARKLLVPFQGLWLSAESDTLVTRVQGRTEDASDATAAIVRRQLDYETGPIGWRGLNAGGSAEEVLRAANAALEVRPAPLSDTLLRGTE